MKKNISISGGSAVIVVGKGSKNPPKKTFCWYGINEIKNFEVGTISAHTIEEAKQILISKKDKGVYTLREIDTTTEFKSLGQYLE